MNQKPIFSILTPVYNVEKFLPTCIESVLAQTFTDWELILVDDGSTDNSGKICDEYAQKYPDKIRVFHKENSGLLATRRYVLSKARGTYYLCLDSDDSLESTALEILSQEFNEYQCDCIVYGFKQVYGNQTVQIVTDTEVLCLTDRRLVARKILLNEKYNSLCRKAVAREKILFADFSKFYHIKYGEDLLQTLQLLRDCKNFVFIPQVLYRYTANPDSMVHTPDVKVITDFLERTSYLVDFLQREHLFTSQDFKDLHAYYIYLLEERIKYTSRLALSTKEKIKIFQQIKDSACYKKFLSSKSYSQPLSPIYTQFRLGLYRLLIAEIQIYTLLKKNMSIIRLHRKVGR